MRKYLVASVLMLFLGLGVGAVISSGAPGDTWHVTFTGEGGSLHQFDATAPDATAARDHYWDHVTNLKIVQTNTTSTTTSTSTTTVPPGAGYPSFSEPLGFDGDFDSGCQTIGGDGGDWGTFDNQDHPGSIAIEHSVVGQGVCAAKVTIPAGSGTGRAELAPASGTPISGSLTRDWEEEFYLPTEANDGPNHGFLNQTKQGGPGGGCPSGGLALDKNTHRLSFNTMATCPGSSVKTPIGPNPAPRGHYFAVKVHEVFADNGSVTVWYDDDGMGPDAWVLQFSKTSVDTLSGNSLKLRQGLYGDEQPHPSNVYIDGFHRAS